MVTLIIPAARDGPDFLNKKPVWLAQLPHGQLCLQQILTDLDCTHVKHIVFVTLHSHIDDYCGGTTDTISRLILETLSAKVSEEDLLIRRYADRSASGAAATSASQSAGNANDSVTTSPTKTDPSSSNGGNTSSSHAPRVTVVALDQSPQSAPETVCLAIEKADVAGPIFVKDSDGSFVHTIEEGDYVCGLCIADAIASRGSSATASVSSKPALLFSSASSFDDDPSVNMHGLLSKSFIERTGVLLTNLVEKKLVSDTIAVGGYGFRSAADFVAAALKAEKIKGKISHALTAEASSSTRVFVSNVVQQMLFDNVAFSVALTRSSLSDWKTEASWKAYLGTYRNVIVALEGELFIPNTSSFAGGRNCIAALTDVASYQPVDSRIDALVALKARSASRCTIIITSREPANCKVAEVAVRRLLEENGVPFDALLMGVPSAHTVLLSSATTVGW